MTAFEQYQAVASHVVDTWTSTPVFMNGEVIDIQPPYLVLDIYNIGMDDGFSCKENIQGGKISCFDNHRGKCHKLTSDVQELLYNDKANTITLERVRIDGSIVKYEDNLFSGTVKFTTRG